MDRMSATPIAVVILAAGKGTRMANPDLPKVMVKLDGQPMLGRVLRLAKNIRPKRIILVIGYHKEMVMDYVSREFADLPIEFVVQEKQLGTGHAVLQAQDLLTDFDGDVLILSGDVPLLKEETIQKLIDYHTTREKTLSMLTVDVPAPTGYGRIIRDEVGHLDKIVEEKDATEEEKKITEINPAIYLVEKIALFNALNHISDHNAQGEYYLTDIVSILKYDDAKMGVVLAEDYRETVGVNTPEELAQAEKIALNE
jgi:bifunctional UDP-N-acetylglucosamine pyrophosphorylase / glucosamine-1-phosphate N-acetyltransferase